MRPYRLIFYFFKCYLDRVQYRTENFDFWDTHFEGLLEALRTYKKYHSRETTIAALLK